MRKILVSGMLLMLAGCSTPETKTRDGLVSAGISRPVAACTWQIIWSTASRWLEPPPSP